MMAPMLREYSTAKPLPPQMIEPTWRRCDRGHILCADVYDCARRDPPPRLVGVARRGIHETTGNVNEVPADSRERYDDDEETKP
ncbi:hypothetical protein LWF01_02845 [Saxibacter everestensis]|uniref:Uncharacterized protein n=1 Tax=Saxibacter everestensis TaxID=2909229 RepID=A0ABY8QV89_9MICO|nr:hypothetical protein LWF01_02845 [Brevibacteriaceae bacterium ZFBP1038]